VPSVLSSILSWAIGFALTLALETPVYVLGLRRRMPARRAALWSLGLNLLTHPAAWTLTRSWSWPRFAAVEIGVWLVEATVLILALPVPRADVSGRVAVVALAFTANALSAGVGLLI
jgi:hypothetical protein